MAFILKLPRALYNFAFGYLLVSDLLSWEKMSVFKVCYVLHENNIFCVSKLWEIGKDREAWRAAVHGISKTLLSDWTTTCKFLGFPGGTNRKELACQPHRRKKITMQGEEQKNHKDSAEKTDQIGSRREPKREKLTGWLNNCRFPISILGFIVIKCLLPVSQIAFCLIWNMRLMKYISSKICYFPQDLFFILF